MIVLQKMSKDDFKQYIELSNTYAKELADSNKNS